MKQFAKTLFVASLLAVLVGCAALGGGTAPSVNNVQIATVIALIIDGKATPGNLPQEFREHLVEQAIQFVPEEQRALVAKALVAVLTGQATLRTMPPEQKAAIIMALLNVVNPPRDAPVQP